MKKCAVQNERDPISTRKKTLNGLTNGETGMFLTFLKKAYILMFYYHNSVFFPVDLSVKSLVKAERESRQVHGYELHGRELTHYDIRHMQPASITDIAGSMRDQLVILVEWAKQIPWFMQKLPLDDQVCISTPETEPLAFLNIQFYYIAATYRWPYFAPTQVNI